MTLLRCFGAALSLLLLVHGANAQDSATLADTISVDQAFIRANPLPGRHSAGYLHLTNNGPAAITLVSATAPGIGRVELHEHAMTDGVMQMREVEGGFPVEPGETLVLEPRGYHLMLMGVEEELEVGGSLPITLVFEPEGELTVDFPIGSIDATAPPL